ncbi:hypothetical protein C448_07819 [Halococcus morrhuae DSM 1307]|uniref:Uncharacterized protein n=1 Tax=Halococcus morrhuae DSM 1307 TaxID=931277 RepID=M0ML67_HALMO|nr:hypothetical protein C448_07819 [Halococcus morrhuae DSM 1307]
MKRLYNCIDEWLRDLSRRRYAAFVGTSAGIGVLIVELSLNANFPIISALTVGLVIFSLECAFGLLQATEG